MRQIQGFCIGHDAADEIRRFLYGLFQAFAADDGRRDDGRKDIPCPAAVAADFFRFDLKLYPHAYLEQEDLVQP